MLVSINKLLFSSIIFSQSNIMMGLIKPLHQMLDWKILSKKDTKMLLY